MLDIARALCVKLALAYLERCMKLDFPQTLFCHKLISSKIGCHSFEFLKDDVLARRLVETKTGFQRAIYVYEGPEYWFTASETAVSPMSSTP